MIVAEKNGGCAYSKVNREKIENVKEILNKFINNDFKHMEKNVKNIENSVANIDKKQDKRPTWISALLVVILTNLVVGLVLAQILQAK